MKSPGPERPDTYVFGRFRLSADGTLLLRDGVPVVLAPKVLRTLVVLVERAGQVVSKADLLQAVWPDSVVEETGLTRNISVLRQALGDDGSALVVTVPRIGYRFAAPVTRVDTPTASQGVDAPTPPRDAVRGGRESARTQASGGVASLVVRSGVAVLGIGVLAALSTGWLRKSSHPTLRVRPLTSEPGPEWCPALSPDGNYVAYVKDEGLYVKTVDGEAPLLVARSRSTPWRFATPVWSPDGRQIAFMPHMEDANGDVIGELLVTSALGGSVRHLTSQAPGANDGLSWSPDLRFLAFSDRGAPDEPPAIFLYSLATGERFQVTSPVGYFGDSLPRFSPDSRTLAFARATSYLVTDVYLVGVDGRGEHRLTEGSFQLRGLDWAADGQHIVFSSSRRGGAGLASLWRVPISGGEPEPLGFGEEGQWPSVARSGGRLAYQRTRVSQDIWRVGGPAAREEERDATRLISSSQLDAHARYSPDGAQIAFTSARSGAPEIWICDSDGSKPRQLTFLDTTMSGAPIWSPDAQQLAFGSTSGNEWDPYVVSATGGVPRRLMERPGFPMAWSRDGRFVYVYSNPPDGRSELWKVAKEGGEPIPAAAPGVMVQESSDGRFLFFGRRTPTGQGAPGIWRILVEGGEETQVLDRAGASWWRLMEPGILYVDRNVTPQRLELFDLGRREVVWSRALDVPVSASHISVSPDSRFVIYTGESEAEADIMLVENFE